MRRMTSRALFSVAFAMLGPLAYVSGGKPPAAPRRSPAVVAASQVAAPIAPQPPTAPETPAAPQAPGAPQTPAPVSPQSPAAATPQTPVPGAPQTPPEAAPPPTGNADHDTALMLLDRIQTLVNMALNGRPANPDRPVGTSGKRFREAGTVKVDRATLDEIRAVTDEVRTMLRRAQQ